MTVCDWTLFVMLQLFTANTKRGLFTAFEQHNPNTFSRQNVLTIALRVPLFRCYIVLIWALTGSYRMWRHPVAISRPEDPCSVISQIWKYIIWYIVNVRHTHIRNIMEFGNISIRFNIFGPYPFDIWAINEFCIYEIISDYRCLKIGLRNITQRKCYIFISHGSS